MSRFVLQKSIRVTGIRESEYRHISQVTSDRVWISDRQNIILTNTDGDKLDHVTGIGGYGHGVHTVSSEGDLIYIDNENNIQKLSKVNKENNTLIKYEAPFKPRSVYSSPLTGDLLVGYSFPLRQSIEVALTNFRVGKVNRYSSTGEKIQIVQHDDIGQGLFKEPNYLTENLNGEVIVSDSCRGVVVMDQEGRHRFSYTEDPSGKRIVPRGICTDALANILVCDGNSHSVQIIDENGHFLSKIFSQRDIINELWCLSYHDKTNLLWVGFYTSRVNIYRYISEDSLTGFPLEDIKCKAHPRIPLDHFCSRCGVPLCVECIISDGHSTHDHRDIKAMFEEICRGKDQEAFLMCLLLSKSYKINMKEENWLKTYNTVANIFQCNKIITSFVADDLEIYRPILKIRGSEVSFSTDLFKNMSFLKLSKNVEFVDIFLTWAEKENIAEYCRSWNYTRREDEVCVWLLPEKTEDFVNRLGEDIFTHPTMEDQLFQEDVVRTFGIPIQIIIRKDKYVKNFIANLKKGKTTLYHASGMIVGCAGSGKTTLLQRLKGINLEEIKKHISSTRGVDIHNDVFDVTDSIKVNSSCQRQHFKISFDDISRERRLPEQEVPEEGKKREHVVVGDSPVEALDHDMEFDYETTSQNTRSYDEKVAPSTDNSMEVTDKNIDDRSKISGNLHIGVKNISEDPDKRITMTDFAGQCAYYASHQIFLSPRAFFILVLNMDEKFDDKVGEDVCRQEGSIYKEWTHRDYLEFWMKSIHQYSNEKAPVILIGTHSENKTEKEKIAFFREIWKTLETKDKSLHNHLQVKKQFSVGFHDNESIEKIKLSIADVVQNLNHWGEELPRSWVMFERFFQEKKSLRIMNKKQISDFNALLPQELRLESADGINLMLQFFHDIREILYFDQKFLNEVIIIDVQWFADAFKNIITDKNHAEEDLFEFAKEWDKFNETGDLDDTLLTSIWKITCKDCIEHKKNIMLYMEKLGLLAEMSDKKWYVPCMNKIPFPANLTTSYPASSILCYVFDILPAGIFHRLIAKCMQIPWRIVTEKDKQCIYQTVAVFLYENHNILLGMTPAEIQIQVFVSEGEFNKATCQEIRKEINNILNVLSETFHKDAKFLLSFKCKATGFCDNQESSVIPESEFIKPTFQCPSCPIGRKHNINSKDVMKYWMQVPVDENEDKDIYKGPLSGNSRPNNMARILKLLQIGTDAVRICFDKFFPKEDLEKTLKENETDMRSGQFRFQQPQLEILFPPQGGSNTGVSSLSMDVTIMYKLLRNFSDIAPPGNGWGKEPKIVHITESDDIERIRLYRNKYSHDSGGSPVMSDDVFNIILADLSKAILRLGGDVLKRRMSEI
ncbi:uncharacterized protein LOC134249448 [Saccostrea cucullata]|uniref:uncharacterized protein LOC134249448 n=1 Tax=Saccostrea cuccullata TaxID=36930 RepID=UPI002ED63385